MKLNIPPMQLQIRQDKDSQHKLRIGSMYSHKKKLKYSHHYINKIQNQYQNMNCCHCIHKNEMISKNRGYKIHQMDMKQTFHFAKLLCQNHRVVYYHSVTWIRMLSHFELEYYESQLK
jgi:hypothetical protein